MKQRKLWRLTFCRANSRSTKRACSFCARSIAAVAAILTVSSAVVLVGCKSTNIHPIAGAMDGPQTEDSVSARVMGGTFLDEDNHGQPCPPYV